MLYHLSNQYLGMELEQKHVHDVYEQIASHFSSTRYKLWPRVDQYLNDQPHGAIGGDIGGGNGKYLNYPNIYMMNGERSTELCKISAERVTNSAHDVFCCDGLALPFAGRCLDFAICIAVIHHFGTRERRVLAIKEILKHIRSGGSTLLYVWALEQDGSRRGWTEGMDQDVFVPWKDNKDPSRVFQRFYHLYSKGELEQDVLAAEGIVTDSGYEKDNWWCIATNP